MAEEVYQIAGQSISDMLYQIKHTGVSEAEASILLGSWLLEHGAKTQRVFSYVTSFPATAPACVETFTPVFKHTDWIDGESVVQAQESAGEEGFNARFHKIEQDFAAVRTDLSQAFACLADMRRQLRTLLDELRTQINLINADIFNLTKTTTPTLPTVSGTPSYVLPFDVGDLKYIGTTKYFEKDVNVWQTSQGTLVLPMVAAAVSNPASDPRVSGTAGIAEFMESNPGFVEKYAGGPVTKEDLVADFGTVKLDNGMTVAEVVTILPDGAKFDGPDALVADLAERQAGAIRSSGGAGVIGAALGVDPKAGAATAPVANLPGVSLDAADALKAGGFDTVEKLATADKVDVAKALTTGGVTLKASDIAGISALAKTFNRL